MKKEAHGIVTQKDGIVLRESILIGSFGGFGVFVFSYEEDGPPHFHVIEGDPRSPDWDVAIRIDRAQYAHPNEGGRLDSEQKRDLVAHLKGPDEYFRPKTRWDVVVALWSMSNPDSKIARKLPMPDFMKLRRGSSS